MGVPSTEIVKVRYENPDTAGVVNTIIPTLVLEFQVMLLMV
jgi:hypothetical protein